MLNLLKLRIIHGYQAIKKIKDAKVSEPFYGFPVIHKDRCKGSCEQCKGICPVNAVSLNPLTIDLGACIFCGDCQRECPDGAITFTSFHKTAVDRREKLLISGNTADDFHKEAVACRKAVKQLFGRSLKLRQVSTGGCNACEMELGACTNVNFDMGRFGIDWVASPRHADGIVITGPITENMAPALEDAYYCTPKPRIVILSGACAISGGLFISSPAIKRDFLNKHPVDLYVPGCPVHPLTFINGVLDFIGK